MNRIFLSLLLILGCVEHAGARVYKWTDENGQVHFSETPPASDEQSDAAVEEVKLHGSQFGALAPEKRNDDWYCGKRRLTFTTGDPVIELSNLKTNLGHWHEQKREATHRHLQVRAEVAAYNSKHRSSKGMNKRAAGALKSLQEITCVVGWAENRIRDLSEIGELYLQEFKALQQQLEKLQAERVRECGTRRDLRSEEATRFLSCENKYKSKIQPVKKQLRYRRSLAESIRPGNP